MCRLSRAYCSKRETEQWKRCALNWQCGHHAFIWLCVATLLFTDIDPFVSTGHPSKEEET